MQNNRHRKKPIVPVTHVVIVCACTNTRSSRQNSSVGLFWSPMITIARSAAAMVSMMYLIVQWLRVPVKPP